MVLMSPWSQWLTANQRYVKECGKRDMCCDNVVCCGGECTQDVQQRFQAQFPNTKMSHHSVIMMRMERWLKMLIGDGTLAVMLLIDTANKVIGSTLPWGTPWWKTGSMCDTTWSGKPTILTAEKVLYISNMSKSEEVYQ